jgi:muconolactone D-isomerase
MLFHVTIAVRVPPDVDREKINELSEKEHARAAELQRQGKWLHLWRVAGKWANVSIFRVDDPRTSRHSGIAAVASVHGR